MWPANNVDSAISVVRKREEAAVANGSRSSQPKATEDDAQETWIDLLVLSKRRKIEMATVVAQVS